MLIRFLRSKPVLSAGQRIPVTEVQQAATRAVNYADIVKPDLRRAGLSADDRRMPVRKSAFEAKNDGRRVVLAFSRDVHNTRR